jgi:hypothetical protein
MRPEVAPRGCCCKHVRARGAPTLTEEEEVAAVALRRLPAAPRTVWEENITSVVTEIAYSRFEHLAIAGGMKGDGEGSYQWMVDLIKIIWSRMTSPRPSAFSLGSEKDEPTPTIWGTFPHTCTSRYRRRLIVLGMNFYISTM